MSGSLPPKMSPASVALKAAPRRVVRFKRNLLIGIAAIGCVAIVGVTWMALKGPSLRISRGGDELHSTNRKPTSDMLLKLPSNYGQLAKPVPQLGPPLPGDLGPPIVAREKQLGVDPSGESFRASSDDAAARAEQLRVAQQARQAREAGVFFQLIQRDARAAPPATSIGPAAASVAGLATDSEAGQLNRDPDRDQNSQQRKLDFVNQATTRGIYNDHALQTPTSPYEVLAGTVIAASLLTGLNSDLPGVATAQVTENVYDTVTGRVLLIPQGSRLIGAYDSIVAFGQSRALLVWQRIIMPDGSSIQIDNLPATDAHGYAGLEDEVDYHTWTLVKGIAMSTLLGVGGQAAFGSGQSNLVEAIRQSTQESTNQAGQRIVEKDLTIQPTITIRPGWPLRVIEHARQASKPTFCRGPAFNHDQNGGMRDVRHWYIHARQGWRLDRQHPHFDDRCQDPPCAER